MKKHQTVSSTATTGGEAGGEQSLQVDFSNWLHVYLC